MAAARSELFANTLAVAMIVMLIAYAVINRLGVGDRKNGPCKKRQLIGFGKNGYLLTSLRHACL